MKTCFKWWNIKSLLSDVWVKLVEKNFAEVLTTIKNYIELCSWQDSEFRLWHYAVEYEYTEAVTSLIESGYEFDVENSPGITPLMTAIIYKDFNEARILHLAHVVDLLNTERNTIRTDFQFLDWRQVEIPIVCNLVTKMQKEGLNSHRIGEALAKVTKFRICDVVCFKDQDITKGFLQNILQPYNLDGTYRAFEIVTPTLDLDHIKVILQNQQRTDILRIFCYYIISNICHYHETRAGQDLLKKVFTWDMFNKDTLVCLEEMLERAERIDSVEIFLKYNFHVIAKEKYGRDLLACLFANCYNPLVVSALPNELIDVNGRGYDDSTPLHFAAQRPLVNNVKLLLDKGADPNVFNIRKETPLELVMNTIPGPGPAKDSYECVKLLLLAGANPFLISNNINRINHSNFHILRLYSTDYVKAMELVTAQAAVFEALGHSIENYVYFELCNYDLKSLYDECSIQLNEMKACKIRDNRIDRKNGLTICSVLGENPKNICRYLVDKDLLLIDTYVRRNEEKLNSHYKDLLKKNMENIVEINRCRVKATQVICEFTGINDPYHLVINKIVNYLTYTEDIRKLSITCTKPNRLKLTQEKVLRFFVISFLFFHYFFCTPYSENYLF